MSVPSDVALRALVVCDAFTLGLDWRTSEACEQYVFLERFDAVLDVEDLAPLLGVAPILHTEDGVQPFLELLAEVCSVHSHDD